MQKLNFKGAVPHLVALAAFIIITVLYFQPLLQGKKIYQGDIVNYKGMSQELVEYRAETGEEALWTNRMFGGMPAYQISHQTPTNYTRFVDKLLRFNLPKEASFVLLSFIGFYILLLSMRIAPSLAIAGAIGFGLSSYIFIILEAGHNTKAHAMAYMAPVLAGIIMAYRGRLIKGAAITSLFLALHLRANHLQITYYLLMMVLLLGLFELIHAVKENRISEFVKKGVVLVFAALLAIGANVEKIWSTYEYGKVSTRSKSELTIDGKQENKTTGLNKDYATSWSYGKMETFNLMIPNFMGGASGSELSLDSETYKVLKQNRVPNAKSIVKRMPTYWGAQPFTSGPVYIGAILCFLFVVGLFLVKGRLKWWLLSCTILSFVLAWGSNMMWLTDIFLDYFPGYNKFRTVSMILVIAEVTIPLLAFLAVKELVSTVKLKEDKIKALKYGLGITGGLCLLFGLIGSSFFTFSSLADSQYPEFLVSALEVDRASMLRSDALRSLLFILMAAGLVYLVLIEKVSKVVFAALLSALLLFDLVPVNKRYLNSDDFVKARKMDQPYQMTSADKQIISDTELNFRVYNPTERLDAGARTSYFHNNIAGYHGAKLKRYQELMDMQISKNNKSVIDMLNVKYIFQKSQSGELVAALNPSRTGAAWFVQNVKQVENADEEMQLLSSFNPANQALVDKRYGQVSATYSTQGSISLNSYKPNHLIYDVNALDNSFAVFSEIFYDKGWNAYIDGELQDHYRVNYVLRGMNLSKGNYQVEFKFEPKSVSVGSSIALVASIMIFVLIGFAAYKKEK
jgi:hypothetical protein